MNSIVTLSSLQIEDTSVLCRLRLYCCLHHNAYACIAKLCQGIALFSGMCYRMKHQIMYHIREMSYFENDDRRAKLVMWHARVCACNNSSMSRRTALLHPQALAYSQNPRLCCGNKCSIPHQTLRCSTLKTKSCLEDLNTSQFPSVRRMVEIVCLRDSSLNWTL